MRKPHKAEGYCARHLINWRKNGDPLKWTGNKKFAIDWDDPENPRIYLIAGGYASDDGKTFTECKEEIIVYAEAKITAYKETIKYTRSLFSTTLFPELDKVGKS